MKRDLSGGGARGIILPPSTLLSRLHYDESATAHFKEETKKLACIYRDQNGSWKATLRQRRSSLQVTEAYAARNGKLVLYIEYMDQMLTVLLFLKHKLDCFKYTSRHSPQLINFCTRMESITHKNGRRLKAGCATQFVPRPPRISAATRVERKKKGPHILR
ncbi:conserved hypothetical protein [Ricinus communis]|uniref:Uncharacterized protein n=1 Tax=Ricinus communis TaxID=3988 RepID=B9RHD6_RICCO|nr:conserved hypothetical protein [Ricinus communis]